MRKNTEEYKFTDFQLEWLDALESGKYKQGKSKLKYTDGEGKCNFCCLGVGCELLNIENKCGLDGTFVFEEDYVFLPPGKLTNALKLNDSTGALINNSNDTYSFSLSYINDTGKSFKEIAKFCRENPEKVFRE